ncbi:MAG: sulfurtransferase TusA family protein [Candidatus Hodarchaeota archaeon]
MRGKVCPMTFVYTKLKLEKLKKDDILDVTLDFEPALKNIPHSCERQKLAILIKVKSINSKPREWVLRLKKI